MGKSLFEQSEDLTAKNTITPVTEDYDESKGVAGRVAELSAQDSPLNEAARTRAAQESAKRGLTNSSLGVQAGEQAVLSQAVPIATADASLYSNNSLANRAARNSAATSNAQIGASLGGQAMGLQSAETQQNKQLVQQQQQIDAQIDQFAKSLGMSAQDLALRRDSLTAQQQQAADALLLQKQQLAQQQTQFDTSLGANQGNFTTELAQRQKQFESTQALQTTMANLDAATKVKLGELELASRSDVQGSVNISNAWQQMMVNVQSIQNNPNLEAAAKTTLINNNLEAFKSFSVFWKKTTGSDADIGDLLTFGMASTPASAPGVVPPGANTEVFGGA